MVTKKKSSNKSIVNKSRTNMHTELNLINVVQIVTYFKTKEKKN